MKVSVIRPSVDEEDEIIFRCHVLSDDMDRFIRQIKYGEIKFVGYDKRGISTLVASDIYYFETVDNKVFAYCRQSVYEVKERLYQLEEAIEELPFMRISKSMIANLEKILHISPALGGRVEALLENNEKVIISRLYAPMLKSKLGVSRKI